MPYSIRHSLRPHDTQPNHNYTINR